MADPYAPQRAEFEDYAKRRGLSVTLRVPGDPQKGYSDQRTRDSWWGWLHAGGSQAPIDMIMHCPSCHTQHVDAPDAPWTNPPHRSHLCGKCGTIWRPADVCTNGVASIATRSKDDTWVWGAR